MECLEFETFRQFQFHFILYVVSVQALCDVTDTYK